MSTADGAAIPSTTPSLTTPEAERAWRAQAEQQLAELRQALTAAQAQAEFQNHRFLKLLESLPGGAGLPGAEGQVLRYNLFAKELEVPAAAAAAQAPGRDTQGSFMAQVLHQNPSPIVRLTATGQVRYLNAAAQAMGTALTDAASAGGYLLPLVRRALGTGLTQQQELRLAGRWYALHAVPGPGESCATLYLTDCTALHCAEDRLAEQREFYETVFNELPVNVVVFTPEHRYHFVNAPAMRDAALREWIIGKDDFEYCAHQQRPAELAAERRRYFEQSASTRTEVRWEEIIPTEHGPQYMLRQFRPVYWPDGRLRLMVGTGFDTTERHHAERKLVEQRAFYEFVLNQLPSDIGIFDAQLRYLFVNQSGIKDPAVREWIIGRTNSDYMARVGRPHKMAEERDAHFRQAFQERRLVTFEESFPRPDGTRHMLRCTQPVFHPDGSPYLIVAYGLDITERVEAEQLVTQAKLAAEESARVKE
ncbi:MAG: hypothetical protein EOO59_06080, partial [Hymenobacter sp.]